MAVISKEDWSSLVRIPLKYLNKDLQAKFNKHGSVIMDYVQGKQIEYKTSINGWKIIPDPNFCEEIEYRVHRPVMKFNVDLQHDEALAIKRVFEGKGLNSEERRVVHALSEEFNKQFGSAFNKGD